MAHAQKPDSVFQRNGRVHLYRRGCQFSRVLAFLECGSGENGCSNTGWTVPSQTEDCLATHSIRHFPLHFSRASPYATRFRFHSTTRGCASFNCQAQIYQVCLTFWRRNYFFKILAHPLYKMWIIQEPNSLDLWNKLHFEEENRTAYTMFKIFSTYMCWINI